MGITFTGGVFAMIKGQARIGPLTAPAGAPPVITPTGPTLIYSRTGSAAGDALGRGVALSSSGDWLIYAGAKAYVAQKDAATYTESTTALPTSTGYGGSAISNDGLYAASGIGQLTRADTASAFALQTVATPPDPFSDRYDQLAVDREFIAASADGQVIARTYEITNDTTPRYQKHGVLYGPGSATNIGTSGTLSQGPKNFGQTAVAPGFTSVSADGQYILFGGPLSAATTIVPGQVFGRFGMTAFDRYASKSITNTYPTDPTNGNVAGGVISADGKRIAVISHTGVLYVLQADTLSPTGFTNAWNLTGETFQVPGTYTFSNALDTYTMATAGNADLSLIALGMPSYNAGAGQVVVLQKTGSTWGVKTVISPSDLTPNARFGCSVSLSADGTRLAVGASAYNGPDNVQNYGKVFVYAL